MMTDESLISERTQINWFENLKLDVEPFIYSESEIDIGFIQYKVTGVDTFDCGIYCGNSDYIKSPFNILSLFWVLNYGFQKKEICITKVKKNNLSVFKYNLRIGFTIKEESNSYYTLELKKSIFLQKNSYFINKISNINGLYNW